MAGQKGDFFKGFEKRWIKFRGSGWDCQLKKHTLSGLEIVTDTVANATNIFSLATKNSSLVAKVVTRFLYDLDLN